MAVRIFISFAKEDIRYRDLLIGQMKLRKSPFQFFDLSLQEPFDSQWKTRCRDVIKSCHGFIALLSKKTWNAEGARWEMRCAVEEHKPILAMHIHADQKGAIPTELRGKKVRNWSWDNIQDFVREVDSRRSAWDRFWG